VLALLALLLTACGGTAAPGASTPAPKPAASGGELQPLLDGARKEGKLSLVWGNDTIGGADGIKQLAAGFNRTYGLDLQVEFTPGPSMSEMAAKALQEIQAKQPATSDIYTGYASYLRQLVMAGALLPSDWTSWSRYIHDPRLVTPDSTAVIVQTSLPGITFNAKKLTGDLAPKSLQDLLKPEYKGHIAAQNVGASFDTVASDEVWGEDRTFDYVRKFVAQTSGIIRCNETQRVANGEFDVLALDCSQSNALKAKAGGQPIDFVVPSDAPIIIYLYMGVPKNAAHPNAARLWIDYMLSREAQDVMYRSNFSDMHLLEGSRTVDLIKGLQSAGVKFTSSDLQFLDRQGDREDKRQETIRKILREGK
jgi:iron(III) transport system substrate-binding protein